MENTSIGRNRVRRMVSVLLLVLSAAGCGSDRGPANAVTEFYGAYKAIGSGGLPSPAQFSTIATFLTPRLRAQFDTARQVQDRFSRRFPEEKPPFVEQDLFSSNFEGFSGFSVDTVTALGSGRYRVRVNFVYTDPVDPTSVVRWHDAVEVVRTEGRYLIDDVEYLGTWPFAQKGKLSGVLRAVDDDVSDVRSL